MSNESEILNRLGIENTSITSGVAWAILNKGNAYVYGDKNRDSAKVARLMDSNGLADMRLVDLESTLSEADIWGIFGFSGNEAIVDTSNFSEIPGGGPSVFIGGLDIFLQRNRNYLKPHINTEQNRIMNALKLAEKYGRNTIVACYNAQRYEEMRKLVEKHSIAWNFLLDFGAQVIR